MSTVTRRLAIVVLAIGMSGCATTLENMVAAPRVELQSVELLGLGFNNQTFLLSFDISNPNPFALPVNEVRYAVELDGQLFATGRTPSELSVPADGDSQFAISVEVDLLRTAPRLLTLVRQHSRDSIGYELEGELGVDIPLAPPVAFRHAGTIRIGASSF